MHTVERAIYDLAQQTPGMFPDPKRPAFTSADMDDAVANFDAEYFTPPVHHGHPALDATDLALGKITGLRLADGKLMATMRVDNSVKKMYDENKLLAHSPEFYRDFEGKGCALRGLGLLGATPPRQKNLPVLFSETDESGDYDIIVFSDNQETGEILMPEPTPPEVTTAPVPGAHYTEEAIEALKAKAVADYVAEIKNTDTFAEAEAEAHRVKLEKENAELKAKLEVQKANAAKADIEAFADSLDYLTPGQRPDVIALLEHLESGDGCDIEVFAEDGASVNVAPRELVARLTKPVADSIRETLAKTKSGAEAPIVASGCNVTLENFAECEATEANLDTVIELYCEKNGGATKSDAYMYLSTAAPSWLKKTEKSGE